MVKDIKEELEKGRRYHSANKEEKKILENKSIDNSSKDFIDDISESAGDIFKSFKKGVGNLSKDLSQKTQKNNIKKKQTSEMSKEELINEIAETKYSSVSMRQLLGGFIGIFIYLIVKVNNDYGWHYGDIIGLSLLAFLPGAFIIGTILEEIKK